MASPEFVPGNLRFHVNEWQHITSNTSVLNTVTGYQLEFMSNPVQEVIPRMYQQSREQSEILSSQIQDLLHKGVIDEIPIYDAKYVSNVFHTPKSNGKHRMIIDLSSLNEYIEKKYFKMDHLDAVLDMVYEKCWFTSVDLQDAYYSVPIFEPHQGYLSFLWEQKMYKFGVLPFGLTSAPRVFTKLLKPVFSSLREEGIACVSYIDDCLIVSSSHSFSLSDSERLASVLTNLGFKINDAKSSLIPSRQITFLGYLIDSISMTISPTDDRGQPSVDLFASRLNHKVSRYASWRYDPEAWVINAFSIDWSHFHLSYVFPPFRLVGRCVRKAKAEGARVIIVAPRWPGQPWYSHLLRGSTVPPLFFRGGQQNLLPVAPHLQDSPIVEIPLVAVLY